MHTVSITSCSSHKTRLSWTKTNISYCLLAIECGICLTLIWWSRNLCMASYWLYILCICTSPCQNTSWHFAGQLYCWSVENEMLWLAGLVWIKKQLQKELVKQSKCQNYFFSYLLHHLIETFGYLKGRLGSVSKKRNKMGLSCVKLSTA